VSRRAQLLAAAAAEHSAWLDEHAEDVPAVAGDSVPHDGDASDYAEHHADRSAPAAVDDLLSSRLVALIAGDDPGARPASKPAKAPAKKAGGKAGGDGGNVDTEETDRLVDDAGDVLLEAGWVPPVPNVLVDLREAGSDRKLRAYWVRGEGAGKIGWKTDGDFTRCVSHLGKYVTDPEGLCAEYHKAATGEWPGKKAKS
jgi:hypothetical protein